MIDLGRWGKIPEKGSKRVFEREETQRHRKIREVGMGPAIQSA